MPAPRWLARFNRQVTNVLFRQLAGWLPGFAIVDHRGRRSGSAYRTPVNAFARPGGYVIALTYGPDADWVKNVLAAGGCELEVNCRGNQPLVRPMLRLGRVTDFLELTLA